MKKEKITLWFTEQFSHLYESGLGFTEGLTVLTKSCIDPHFVPVLEGILRSIKRGRGFAESLLRYGDYFNGRYIAMVRVGEQTGSLGWVMGELAAYQKMQIALKEEVTSALTYPLITLGLLCCMLVFMYFFVIPPFQEIFAHQNVPLPFLTRCLFAWVHLMQEGGLIVILGVFAFLFIIRKKLLGLWRPYQQEVRIFRIPFLGPCYQEILLMFFFKNMSLALKTGLSFQQGLALLSSLFVNSPFSALIKVMQYDLVRGKSLSQLFDRPLYFPAICGAFVSIAEASGAADQQFQKLALHFERQVNGRLAQLKIWLEPVLLMGTGGIVGLVVLALYQPLFSLGAVY